mgnify:CR=1 FL=1
MQSGGHDQDSWHPSSVLLLQSLNPKMQKAVGLLALTAEATQDLVVSPDSGLDYLLESVLMIKLAYAPEVAC